MKAIVSLNNQGRLTIPDAMRKAMRLEPGAQLELEIQGSDLILRPVLVIPREDAWAYTPEHRAAIERASQSPTVPNVGEADLVAIMEADDPEAAARDLIRQRLDA